MLAEIHATETGVESHGRGIAKDSERLRGPGKKRKIIHMRVFVHDG